MSTQIFRTPVPSDDLFALLKNIGKNCDKYCVINNESYKRGIFTNSIPLFLEECKNHYHVSKYKYLERKLSYNNFTTVLRQICNYNKIKYTTQIIYEKSSYNIVYYIYF